MVAEGDESYWSDPCVSVSTTGPNPIRTQIQSGGISDSGRHAHFWTMEGDVAALTTASLWACPRCHSDLSEGVSTSSVHTFPIKVPGRIVHGSATLDHYASSCPNCGLPYTNGPDTRFEYPYRQLLAEVNPRKFLRWSAAQNNGYISYTLMRGSSCSIEGREDVMRFSEFIRDNVTLSPKTCLDLGCGPLARPSYLPSMPGTQLIGVDPFDSEWEGSFILGAGEFLPLATASIDLGVAATALDHTLDLAQTLRELARVIREGGSLMVWDHKFKPAWRRSAETAYGLLRSPFGTKIAQIRASLFPERVRVYDNGIVLWTPRGFADPFHEPRSRRPSWQRKLRRAIEEAGFVQAATDSTRGFSHYIRS